MAEKKTTLNSLKGAKQSIKDAKQLLAKAELQLKKAGQLGKPPMQEGWND